MIEQAKDSLDGFTKSVNAVSVVIVNYIANGSIYLGVLWCEQ